MSVIYFEENEIDAICNKVASHQQIRTFLKTTQHFQKYEKSLQFYKSGLKEEGFTGSQCADIFLNSYIARLFWYVQIANQVAYSLQYRENINFFKKEGNENCNPKMSDFYELEPVKEINSKKLADDLGGLHYNIFTNDGDYFIAEKYLNALEAIKKTAEKYNIAKIYTPEKKAIEVQKAETPKPAAKKQAEKPKNKPVCQKKGKRYIYSY